MREEKWTAAVALGTSATTLLEGSITIFTSHPMGWITGGMVWVSLEYCISCNHNGIIAINSYTRIVISAIDNKNTRVIAINTHVVLVTTVHGEIVDPRLKG